MSLAPGTRLGAYEIVALIGAGGMGEVYRAKDTRLKRDVAIKILPETFASDPERLARFQREAELLATLNHPHIGAIYGFEQSETASAIVLELIEGETLAERIQRGPIPVKAALNIAQQIAEALEAAHERGVIHRDLKPSNIKLTLDETVKVLDFGLAKAMEATPAGNLTHSPTLSIMATQAGMVMGTAAYMSPEQAKGLPADQRSDVFSFGTVLYEILTGRRPFHGDTAPDVLASVIIRDADLNALPAQLNPRVRELIQRCLEKNPKKRWQAIGDVRAELETIAAAPHASSSAIEMAGVRRPTWERAIPVVAVAVVFSVVTAATVWNFRPGAAVGVTRFLIILGEGQRFTNAGRRVLAIAADGTQLAYVANSQLYVRSMSQIAGRPVPGSEMQGGVLNPVFSPDGSSIAFWSGTDATIKRIAVAGGAAVTICPATRVFGMSWSGDTILFGQANRGIMRVSARGGTPEIVISTKGSEQAHGPELLPDDGGLLFTLATETGVDRWDKAKVVVHSLHSGERKTLIEGGSDASYVATGHVVYALRGVLFAVAFDARRLEVTGEPVPVVEGVWRSQGNQTGTAHFSVSANGSLIYVPGPASSSQMQDNLVLIDRKGVAEILKAPMSSYGFPRASPDGKWVAVDSDDGKERIIWIYDLSGAHSMRRLTLEGGNRFPVWSADSRDVTFQSDREGDLGLFRQRADGSATADRLTKPDNGTTHVPYAWSPDGRTLLFGVSNRARDGGIRTSLWSFSAEHKSTTPVGVVETTLPINAVFSPDGRWLAYNSNETGRTHVFVQPFPPTGVKYQVTKDGGHHPLWLPNGKELFFIPGTGRFAAMSIATDPSLTWGDPVAVPKGGFSESGPTARRSYDFTRDGTQVVGIVNNSMRLSTTAESLEIQVVLNWHEELKQRVPIK